ncbi:MAG: YjgP/YjgQ family permease [Candidatus Atribacteria bacterium]|nr:MAG: YjgP/YjgQ family permease [Candidatus Atribacteria bacterium]
MKKLHLLVIKSFVGPLILTFFFVIFILLMQFLWKYINDLIGKGLEMGVISEFLLYTSASLVPMAMPLAVLLASLMTFGNLAENLELLAFKSSGISLVRIMAPVMVISVVLSVGAFMFANYVMPVTNLKMRSLLYDIQQQRPELTIKPGVFDNTLEGYSIRIGSRDSKTSLLKDILIFDHTKKQGNIRVTVADSGYMRMSADEKNLLLTLYNGHTYEEMQKLKEDKKNVKDYPFQRDEFEEQDMIIEMTGFGLNRTDENLFRNAYSMLNITQLKHFEDSLVSDLDTVLLNFNTTLDQTLTEKPKTNLIHRRRILPDTVRAAIPKEELTILQLHVATLFAQLNKLEQRRALTLSISFARNNKSLVTSNAGSVDWKISKLRRYQIEIQRKYTLSFLCLIFFFIGAPLGAIIRKGGLGLPVIVSVLLFLIYYVISMTGEKFVRESILSPFVGMWFSSFILIPISILLTYKAANDSVIMNVDTYFIWAKKIRLRAQKFFRRR